VLVVVNNTKKAESVSPNGENMMRKNLFGHGIATHSFTKIGTAKNKIRNTSILGVGVLWWWWWGGAE